MISLPRLLMAFPGLFNGQEEVNGGDLVEWLSRELVRCEARQAAFDSCINYILEFERADFYRYAFDKFKSLEEFKSEWQTFEHVYVDALIASDNEPDWDSFSE